MLKKVNKNDEKDMTTVNLTSMTDVLMTLLILFMVMESSQATLGFNLNLPNVVAPPDTNDPTVLISYSAKRKLFVTTSAQGDQQLQREKLRTYLARIKKQYNYKLVVIKADSKLTYKEIISIMDDAKRAGYEDISLATSM